MKLSLLRSCIIRLWTTGAEIVLISGRAIGYRTLPIHVHTNTQGQDPPAPGRFRQQAPSYQ